MKKILLALLILITLISYSNSKYDVFNDDAEIPFEYCDHGSPDTIGDCTKYQTEDSSCCYYEFGGTCGCIMIGIRYLGKIEYGGMEVECSSFGLSSKVFTSLLIVLFYIFM